MDDLYLQAVIVRKTIPKALARYKAQQFIQNKNNTFSQETETEYRFRNLPKRWFRTLETRKINEDIQLVVGNLHDAIRKTLVETT